MANICSVVFHFASRVTASFTAPRYSRRPETSTSRRMISAAGATICHCRS